MAKKPTQKGPAAPDKKPGQQVAEAQLGGGKALILIQDDTPDYIKPGQNRGNENVQTDDLVIPRLEIIQALSPQVKEGDAKYNPQARPGMMFNTVTGKLYDKKEVFIVPIFYQKVWNVWMARKTPDGKPLPGGFFGSYHSPDEAADRQKKEGGEAKFIEVIDTPQHYCLLVDAHGDGSVSEIMLSMPRTKAKRSRELNSMVKLAGGDRYARVYRIGTQLEKNPKGDFYNYSIAPCGHPAKALYDKAEMLYKAVSTGARRVVGHEDGSDPGADTAAGAEM